ncbi:MAG: peptidoglycan DD-metalloendopeptidase family protein [Gammaproteobacteria bacterium]|nr:peptidoglycan DD-metalloendopeptidase family protein [Gammaproteobacteria bacterium]
MRHSGGLSNAMLFWLAASLMSPPLWSQTGADEQQLEQQLQAITAQLQTLQANRVEQNASLEKLQTELADNAASIRLIEKALQGIEAEQQRLQQSLQGLRTQAQQQSDALQQQRQQLAQQVVNAYVNGNHSRLKLLLNQQDPASSSRLLAYHGYLADQRADIISAIDRQYQTLQDTRQRMQQQETALSAQAAEQQQVLDGLQQQLATGRSLRDAIRHQLDDIDLQMHELQQNQQQLEALLASLRDVFADIPEQLMAVAFNSLRGQLPWPVAIEPAARRISMAYGDQRQAGTRSTGVFISTAAGLPVQAVARGRVVFADWLRGYGWLMILDHGDDYMSLYGNNARLLHEVGNWVDQGQQIAVTGSDFGADLRSGVYFELRQGEQAINPKGWLRQ